MTVPYRLMIYAPPETAAALAADLAAGNFPVPGVHGPDASARAFAAAWCAPRGLRGEGERRMRAFELTAVTPPPATPGRMRRAGPADEGIVASFYRAFFEDTGSSHAGASPEDLGLRALREGRLRLWEDGAVVCQAVDGGSTPSGKRVGAVYTPPAHRRRGYATALVAALSRELLAEGARRCFLFTDLANPVSNSIYPKIGYRPVADFAEIDFIA
jgi:GNAT superfamily N-acetyltransferase